MSVGEVISVRIFRTFERPYNKLVGGAKGIAHLENWQLPVFVAKSVKYMYVLPGIEEYTVKVTTHPKRVELFTKNNRVFYPIGGVK